MGLTPRSWLFVPGDSPRKMGKAVRSGADALILDLEDSVASAAKADARAAVRDFLNQKRAGVGPQLWVRINPLVGGQALDDLNEIVPARPAGVVLPKPDSADDVRRLARHLEVLEAAAGMTPGALRVLPVATETPISIFRLDTYVTVRERLGGLTWGAEDLSAAVGAATNRTDAGDYTPLYQLARALCLAAAAAAGTPAIETVYPDFRDLKGLAAYAARGRREGFLGMMAIHPDQVPVINAAFTPTEAELSYARRVIELFEANPGAGTLALDGRMLDAPHLAQARRICATAGG